MMFARCSPFHKKDPAVLKLPSPNKYFDKKHWVKVIVSLIGKNPVRDKIFLFDDFPPEYVDYYKALQEKIAEQIPAEQNRPFICLNIRGFSHATAPKIGQNNFPLYADIGMAGGTGPLSDATALTNLVGYLSGIDFSSEEVGMREAIATKLQHFSGVMYSMPPPRDLVHMTRNATTYAKLYRKARRLWPCLSLHILTNTGHSNKDAFDGIFGPKSQGLVDDMTVKVADRIQQESKGDKILILGTIQADHDQLYSKLLGQRELKSTYPEETYHNTNSKDYLQKIIDQTKAGKVNTTMPDEQSTCGQAFIDFAVHYAIKYGCRTLLFSCTELPMLLHTKIPGEDRTYLDKLETELVRNIPGGLCKFYDTEKIFVEEIANTSLRFQTNPEQRSEHLQNINTNKSKPRAKPHDFIVAGEENSFIQEVIQIFKMYDEIIYTLLKWSITVPVTFIGNIADLALFTLPKKLIDTSSFMQFFPFFRVLTRIKEDGYSGRVNGIMNKGFGGLARCAISIAIEVPVSLVAVIIAAVLTIVHLLLAKTIGVPIAAFGRCVRNHKQNAEDDNDLISAKTFA